MVSRGVERYKQNVEERGLANAGPGKALRQRALEPTAAAITVKLASVKRGRGRHADPVLALKPALEPLDAHVLADLTMRRALDGASRGEKLLKVTKSIGATVEWHVRDAQLYAANRALWNKKQDQLKTTQNAEFRRRAIDGSVESLRSWAHAKGITDLATKLDSVKGIEWSDEQMVDAGVFLLDCFCEASALVTTEEVRSGRFSSKAIVRFSEGAEEWLKAQHEFHSLLRPVFMPMVVEPLPWSSKKSGGYLDNSKARVPFIMTRAKDTDRDTAAMDDAYDAVNVIQSTPLRVNQSVFGVMRAVWDAGSGIGRVPPKFFEDGMRPLLELTEEQKAMTPAQRKADQECRTVMRKRRAAHEFNALFRAEVDDFGRLMAAADEYSAYDAFWLPYKLDWRQRCYPVVSVLSPQGDQFNRGLIEFARGKRMGGSENAAAWLAIHGANVYGIDKVPFEDRIAWVEAHQSEIISAAVDPLGAGKEFWTQAGGGAKAWPFLAFCFEWTAYLISGADHITHLPVALDGSNSGLQHLSAMVRDSEGAKATNVAPCETPADIYTEICERVEQRLTAIRLAPLSKALGVDAGETEDTLTWARIWCGKVARKVCKQPTMTYAYSATLNGMVTQIESALAELDLKAQSQGKPSYLPFTDREQDNEAAARFLAPIVLEAIQGRLPKAAAAMDFLVACARIAASTDLPLRWVTPLGVPIVQYYPKLSEYKKSVFVDGRRFRLSLMRPDPTKLDKRACAYGVSPNFVHSMDSSHLLWTVLACSDEFGIADFAVVHDSFGTHATQCDELALMLREMFVRLYSENRLEQFRAELAARLPPDAAETLPQVPEMGTFDLESVRESQYFFA